MSTRYIVTGGFGIAGSGVAFVVTAGFYTVVGSILYNYARTIVQKVAATIIIKTT